MAKYLFKEDFFLPFWASINDLSPSFHTVMSSSCMPSPGPPPTPPPPSLTPTYGWCRCYSNEWRNDNDPGNLHLHALPLIMFIIHGMSLKIKVTQIPLEESRIRPGHGEQDSSKFSAHHEKTLHTGNARLHWFCFSRSAWIDNRCLLSPSISHSSSTSPVLECSQKVS